MKKTRIKEDFVVTPRIRDLARQKNWPNPDDELDAFRDHHLAKGSLMADWEAAFRTWLRNGAKWQREKPHPTNKTKVFIGHDWKKEEEKKIKDPRVKELLRQLTEKWSVK